MAWIDIGKGKAAGVATIIGLFTFLSMAYHFEIKDITGDFVCEGTFEHPCISRFSVKNPNAFYVDVRNSNDVHLGFTPEIEDYALFVKDGRCSATGNCACALKGEQKIGFKGWRCMMFTNETKLLKDKAYVYRFPAYSTTDFLLVGIKKNPMDTIKWSFASNNFTLDPVWIGQGRASLELKCLKSVTTRTKVSTPIDVDSGFYLNGSTRYSHLGYDEHWIDVDTCVNSNQYLTIGTGRIDLDAEGLACSNSSSLIVCDSTKDGNGDTTCTVGESCLIINGTTIENIGFLSKRYQERIR